MRHHLVRIALTVWCGATVWAADPLDALIRERVLTLPPDLVRTKTYPEGSVASGDLFKSGKRMVVAVARDADRSVGVACFVHRDGDWRELFRQALSDNDQRLTTNDEVPFSFTDLDGDGKPELLLTEQGSGDDRVVRIFRYDAEQSVIVAAGGGLRNPQWQDGVVRGQWKLGPTAGDVGAEQHRWVDGRLQPVWRSAQSYPMQEYLIGGGEPAVRVQQQVLDASGALITTSAVGNLASFRNRLPAGEQPRAMHVLVREAKGRRLVEVTPKDAALRSANRSRQWDELVSRAVFNDPAAFSADLTVTLGDGGKVKLSDVATVTIAPITVSPTYQFLPISDEVRRTIEEPTTPTALAARNAGTTDVLKMEDVAMAWAAAAAKPAPLTTGDDVLVFLRLPNITSHPRAQIETGTLITALTLNDQVVEITVTMDPGAKPSLPPKAVTRPLLAMSLGWLAKGTYRMKATITGHPDGPLKAEHAFSVQ
jgi:hypothetical protein